MKVLVTGSAGFLMGYLVPDLLSAGYEVIGIDNYSKYGRVRRSYDNHPSYRFIEGDVKDVSLLSELAEGCQQIVASASIVGGVRYLHAFPYDLLVENERITASTFDAAINAFREGSLRKINLISSSMVYQESAVFPTPEGTETTSPPPRSSYGFQKLSSEYFARAAWRQYGLPYTIIRPFNCIGAGEVELLGLGELLVGNFALMASHVVPDLVLQALKGEESLHIIGSGRQTRHYTYAGDVARGIRLCMENSQALNTDFNLATAESTTVLELATSIWQKVHGLDRPVRIVHDPPFEDDVEMRWPDVSKARELLGFEAPTRLDAVLNSVLAWLRAWSTSAHAESASSSRRVG